MVDNNCDRAYTHTLNHVFSMVINMAVRKKVKCSFCGDSILRVVWNYAKNRPIDHFFCDRSCKGAWQKKQREDLGFDMEWLTYEYHTKGKSANQIAREVGRDPKRVWEWIKDYGLETRPRGTDYGQCFKKGEESKFKGMKHSEETKKKIREISIKDGRVPYLKEGKHWLKHEGAVSPAWKGGITPERQQLYSTQEWADVVLKVWERDESKCQKCGKSKKDNQQKGEFHIHHITGFKVKELRLELSNLVLLCKSCHRWVHSKNNTSKEFLNDSLRSAI